MVVTVSLTVKPRLRSCYNRAVTAYQEFLQHVNELSERLQSHYARHLVCRAGCSGCCHHHLSVFRIEADAIAESAASLPDEVRQRVIQQAKQITDVEGQACP
ncbi:MAG: hypothetical protein HOP19_00910, partial [Acidobacteria bacterium]|nr:hypothetical protein [Acidobacteriota bacterium]